MKPEVMPPRRAFSLRGLLLVGVVSGCAAHAAATSVSTSVTTSGDRTVDGYPLSSLQVPAMHRDEYGCAHSWFQPATLCVGNTEIAFDGCSWHCVERPLGRVQVITTPGGAPRSGGAPPGKARP